MMQLRFRRENDTIKRNEKQEEDPLRKILYCASTLSHIQNFHLPYLKAFHDQGYEVWVAANEEGSIPYADHVVALPFAKSLLSLQNVEAIFLARKLLKEQHFEFVSTHTALASAVVRAAISLLRNRPKVFCTIHGYLFNENDGLKKWVYLLPEKICAHVTDVLMVMNQEDYEIAQNHHLYKEYLHFIHGIGFDSLRFQRMSIEKRIVGRQALGFGEKDFLFIYAAEFSKRKNQESLIRSFAKAVPYAPNAHLLLAGTGTLLKQCIELTKELYMEDRIHFLGHVQNMENLYPLCDAAVSSSKIEGLPFNVMEAMACGLPVLISDIKGHRDLMENEKEFLFHTEQELTEKIINYTLDSEAFLFWKYILEKYKLNSVKEQIIEIYNS